MELKLGGNVKDIVVMMYVGALYEKIPDISLKEIHEKLIYGGVSGNSVITVWQLFIIYLIINVLVLNLDFT